MISVNRIITPAWEHIWWMRGIPLWNFNQSFLQAQEPYSANFQWWNADEEYGGSVRQAGKQSMHIILHDLCVPIVISLSSSMLIARLSSALPPSHCAQFWLEHFRVISGIMLCYELLQGKFLAACSDYTQRQHGCKKTRN